MKGNALIEEIRAVRHEISAEHGHDTHALVEHYRELEKKYANRMVREAPPLRSAKRD
jgi:hypothetical protein